MKHAALVLALLFAAPALAGCLDGGDTVNAATLDAGALDGYDTSRGWSMPRSPSLYEALPSVKAFVPAVDGVELAVGLFLPAIEGCDWESAELPESCKLPVVMDAGPYYGAGVAEEKFRPPLGEWLVPRGYAVAHMSLRGTGESGGCLEFKNPKDVDDISDVITWLAAQSWSNGNVGMMGRSYDGTSAWAGAASGNPALKAIVPISGAVNGPFLYYKNGTAELRGFINGGTYFPTYATDAIGPADYPQRLCQGALADSHRESAYSSATGDASSAYWQSRDLRPLILENYKGAAWVIHGMEDWNVNPSQTAPFIPAMQDAGIDVKAWLGVWAHAYPDRIDEHRNVRWDWADTVVRYFDRHLKGLDVDTGPAIEVEDTLYVWRAEESWPPRDATFEELFLSNLGKLTESPESGVTNIRAGQSAAFTSTALSSNMRVSGMPQVHVTVTPTTTQGGYVFAELYDIYPDGRSVRIGWGAIDLRHHEGGNGAPETLTPGTPVVALLEMEPVDAHVGAGHKLRLVLHKDGVEDIVQSPSPEVNVLTLGEASVLRLPTIERPDVLPSYAPPRVG